MQFIGCSVNLTVVEIKYKLTKTNVAVDRNKTEAL